MRGYLSILFAVAAFGCGATKASLLRRAASDLSCSEDRLALTRIDGRTQRVQGCGQTATYVSTCGADQANCTWALNSEVRSAGEGAGSAVTEEPARETEEARIEQARARNGAKMIRLYLRGGHDWMVYVSTAPGHDADRATLFWRVSAAYSAKACEIKLVANGERIELGSTSEPIKNESSTDYRASLSYASLLELAAGQRVVGKLCELELTLTPAQLEKLRELVMRIKETKALEDDAAPTAEPENASTEL